MDFVRPNLSGQAACRTVLVAWALVVAAAGCNRQTCAGLHPPSVDANAPKLIEVAVVQQDVFNPWQFVFAVTFQDADGDLEAGRLDIYVGTSEPVSLPLAQAFATSSVAPNATAGRLGVDVNLSSSSVQDDNILRLGFQLLDGGYHYGNCYTLDLHFDIDRLGALQPGRVRPVACASRLAMRGQR